MNESRSWREDHAAGHGSRYHPVHPARRLNDIDGQVSWLPDRRVRAAFPTRSEDDGPVASLAGTLPGYSCGGSAGLAGLTLRRGSAPASLLGPAGNSADNP
jgi:hypothetical protein